MYEGGEYTSSLQPVLVLCPNPSIDAYIRFNKFSFQQVNRVKKEQFFAGGKGIHVALALKELGCTVNLKSLWAGATGDWLKKRCREKNIICSGPTVEGWNRFCYTFQGNRTIQNTEILGRGPSVNKQEIAAFAKDMYRQINAINLICMSGSWPAGTDSKTYANIIAMANKQNKKVFLDCSEPWLKPALEKKPFAVHVNKEEGEALFDTSDNRQIILQLKKYCQIAAVTDGERGLYLLSEGEAWHSSCPLAKVISPVGSGDCLVAGLVWAFRQNRNLKEMARWGVACGAANCINEGLGRIKKEDVVALMEKVKCEKLKTL